MIAIGNLMKTGTLVAALAVGLSLLGSMPASAQQGEDVKIFKGEPPAPDDLANMLFPKQKEGVRFRAINIKGTQTQQPAAESKPFGLQIQFKFDSTEILSSSYPYLDSVGNMLKSDAAKGRSVVVEGHTDSKGTDEYNQKLSEQRAASVKQYLMANHGIDGSRLKVTGYGESRPLNGVEPDSSSNRRVQFRAVQ